MLDLLTDFIDELRVSGVPVSLREAIDAADATREIRLEDRVALRSALCSTLVKDASKRRTFDTCFEIFFSIRCDIAPDDDAAGTSEKSSAQTTGSSEESPLTKSEIDELAATALRSGEASRLEALSRLAVARYGGIEPSRPVGVSYYLHRTVSGLGLEELLARLLSGIDEKMSGDTASLSGPEARARALGALGKRLLVDEYQKNADRLRSLIEAEIRRQLVKERGAAAVARSLRKTPLDEVEFMHATRDELEQMSRAIYPLARILAARLARRRRQHRHGPLDFRATIRRSLSTGGVPLEPRFRPPHPSRPEIVVLADVSGSVAAFARFTVQLVYAISSQFSKVRSIVFIDGADEVTELFKRASSIKEATEAIALQADVVSGDGHSDYGAALLQIRELLAHGITGRTNVLILGDARNNYHASNAYVLKELAKGAKHVFWLNPEPHAYWGSGDSIAAEYARHVDQMFECRNLAQLKAFVDNLA